MITNRIHARKAAKSDPQKALAEFMKRVFSPANAEDLSPARQVAIFETYIIGCKEIRDALVEQYGEEARQALITWDKEIRDAIKAIAHLKRQALENQINPRRRR